jgi:putative protease
LYDKEKHGVNTSGQYLLSPKDLCGLESIPDLIEAGVDSFKIEGRMKKPEYVAVCVNAYRKCVDAWFENRFSQDLVKKCKEDMAAVFNRGGFTKGYYRQHNGRDMMSIENPGNIGVAVGKITDISKNRISIDLDRDVSVGDILVISGKEDEVTLTCNVTGNQKHTITLNAPRSKNLKKGQRVFRMQDAELVRKLQALMEEPKIVVSGQVNMRCGCPAEFILKAVIKGEEYTAKVYGDVVETANANPMTEEVVCSKMSASGGTRYKFENLTVNMEQDIFYSLKGLKELRRNGLGSLEKEILSGSRRVLVEEEKPEKEEWNTESFCVSKKAETVNKAGLGGVRGQGVDDFGPTVMVSGMEQYQVVAKDNRISDIYLDLQYFTKEGIMKLLQSQEEKHHFLVLPPVLRRENLPEVTGLLEEICLGQVLVAGIVVRNLDELGLLINRGYKGKIITDYSLYAMNHWSAAWLLEQHQQIRITIPVELNGGQLAELTTGSLDYEWVVYGYQQLMVSAQCVRNTVKGCNQKNEQFFLKDRYGKMFPVRCICKYCYNLIYNSVPTVLFGGRQEELLNGVTQRIHFTVETEKEIKEVLDAFWNHTPVKGEMTRGHYRRGVE